MPSERSIPQVFYGYISASGWGRCNSPDVRGQPFSLDKINDGLLVGFFRAVSHGVEICSRNLAECDLRSRYDGNQPQKSSPHSRNGDFHVSQLRPEVFSSAKFVTAVTLPACSQLAVMQLCLPIVNAPNR
jgi:hypothetical protein